MTAPEARQAASEARKRLVDALEPVALLTPEGRFDDAPRDQQIVIGQHQVRAALQCPARAAMPDGEFAWSPAFATRTLATAAASRALEDGAAHWEPLDLVRAEARRLATAAPSSSFEEWWAGASHAVRAAAMSRAARHLTHLFAAIGMPPPDGALIGPGGHRRWTQPDRALRLTGRHDAVVGRSRPREDDREIHLLLGSNTPVTRAIAAFEALVATVAAGSRPAKIVMTAQNEGRRIELTVDDPLLHHGIAAAAMTAEILAARLTGTSSDLERRPGHFTCLGCPESDTCAERAAAEAEGPTTRGGFPTP